MSTSLLTGLCSVATMYLSPQITLICPLDGMPLSQQGNSLCCVNKHSFDIAKQGYVNLLPVQYKKSKQPGDSKAMIDARSRFLNAGYYDRISQKLNDLVSGLLLDKSHINILDAGCGEGFYLDACMRSINNNYPDKGLACLGLDISKPAIVAAAKRNRQITWLVGTNKAPPVAEHSIDIVICMFGFCELAILHKILKPGGYVILVDAGTEHLLELRKILYPIIRSSDKQNDFRDFELIDNELINYNIQLNQREIADLLLMTPHLYRATKEGKDAAQELEQIQLTVDVLFRVLKAKYL